MAKEFNNEFDDELDDYIEYQLEENNENNKDKNWIRMPTDKEVEMHEKLVDIAYSRLSKGNENINEMDINDFIASLTNLSCSPIYNPPFTNIGLKIEETIGVYTYLRNNFIILRDGKKDRIKTPKEAENFILKTGKVNPKIIKLWLEEEILVNPNALKKGYPQFKNEIECLEKKYNGVYKGVFLLKHY